MAGRVAGKVALITGGASGIGRGCGEKLAAGGGTIVTDEAAWESVVAEVKTREGRLDILVNNAGIGIGGSIIDMSLADWRRQTAINLDGVFLGVKHSIPLM